MLLCGPTTPFTRYKLSDICVQMPGVNNVYAKSQVVVAWGAPFVTTSAPITRRTAPFEVSETLVTRPNSDATIPGSLLDRRATMIQDLLIHSRRARTVVLAVLHRRANGRRFYKLATCRFRLPAHPALESERVLLTLLRGRLRLSFRLTMVPASSDDVLQAVSPPPPPPLPLVKRLTSPGYVRKGARTSGFGFGLEALDEPEPELDPSSSWGGGLEDAALLGSASLKDGSWQELAVGALVEPSYGGPTEDRVSYLYRLLSQLSAARSRTELGGGERASRGSEEIEKLQIELTAREQERAETEERLCGAFQDTLRELHQTVGQLTAERDALALALEQSRDGQALRQLTAERDALARALRRSRVVARSVRTSSTTPAEQARGGPLMMDARERVLSSNLLNNFI